jgi:Protein of unknown function (DUF2970)
MNDKEDSSPDARDDPDKLNPLQVVGSVLAAGLGVQSSKNRERDFKQGRLGVFIAAGIVFTLLFIGIVMFVVQLVLSNAGK